MPPKQGRTIDRTTGETREGTIRPFADVLRELGKGQVADEAAVLLTDLVQAVTTYGKQGRFNLSIVVAPVRGTTGQVTVSATAKSSPPEADPIAAVFFTDDAGNLSRNDPRMDTMFDLREVAKPDADLRDIQR
jgi:hypothetical protein